MTASPPSHKCKNSLIRYAVKSSRRRPPGNGRPSIAAQSASDMSSRRIKMRTSPSSPDVPVSTKTLPRPKADSGQARGLPFRAATAQPLPRNLSLRPLESDRGRIFRTSYDADRRHGIPAAAAAPGRAAPGVPKQPRNSRSPRSTDMELSSTSSHDSISKRQILHNSRGWQYDRRGFWQRVTERQLVPTPSTPFTFRHQAE